MKRRFSAHRKPYCDLLQKHTKEKPILKQVDDDDKIWFTWEQMYLVAKATGLRSNTKRHIIKRFRLVMYEAIEALLEEHSIDNTP